MKYMLLMYSPEDVWETQELERRRGDAVQLCHELSAKGQYLGAAPLQPVATATSVRVRDGRRSVTDGPFAETKEQLAGYALIDVANLDEAIAVAARFPGVEKGTAEIRPVVELPGLPDVPANPAG